MQTHALVDSILWSGGDGGIRLYAWRFSSFVVDVDWQQAMKNR
jgi:hypothetical protein